MSDDVPTKETPDVPTPELRPCPFCGGKAYYTRSVSGSRMHYCGCGACGVAFKALEVYSPAGWTLTKDIADAWNKRVLPKNCLSQLACSNDR